MAVGVGETTTGVEVGETGVDVVWILNRVGETVMVGVIVTLGTVGAMETLEV